MLLTGSLNKGLSENSNLPRFYPLRAGAQLEVVAAWLEAGVDVHTAARFIYDEASRFKPTEQSPQIRSLRYFDQRVRELVSVYVATQKEPVAVLSKLQLHEGDTEDQHD